MGKLIVVAGAQFGSEGKGALADQLTRPERVGADVVAVRVAGPNAGHTVYGLCPPQCEGRPNPDHMFNDEWIGHPWKLRSVPVSAVSNPDAHLVIAAGSEVDEAVLRSEINDLDAAGYDVTARLMVDNQATILQPKHVIEEVEDKIQERLGSTAKGIGAARADRLWRHAPLWGDSRAGGNTAAFTHSKLDEGYTVLVEGTQGYGLGLHAGSYPFCTSSDCRAIDFLAMAGLSPWSWDVSSFEIWLAARVRPIRVAGNSGPLKGETTWQALGLPAERTTVTNKIRRVGEWDSSLVNTAVRANGGSAVVRLALTMADTKFPELTGANGSWLQYVHDNPDASFKVGSWMMDLDDECGARIGFVGTGPTTGLFVESAYMGQW